MRPLRFVLTDAGLVLETPVPLSKPARDAAASYALRVNKQRFNALPAGARRDNVFRTIRALMAGDFTERAVPVSASRHGEVVLHG